MSIKNKSFFLYSSAFHSGSLEERKKWSSYKPLVCTECGKETMKLFTRGTCYEDVEKRFEKEKLCAECAVHKIRTTVNGAIIFEIIERKPLYRIKTRVQGRKNAYLDKIFMSKGLIGCHRQNLWFVRNAEDNQKITWKLYFVRMMKYLLRIKEKEDVDAKKCG